jgi:AcrR family transcriptional regulator
MNDRDEAPTHPRRRSAGPQRSTASHEAILAAADELLAESGPAGVTFEAVARRAKAGKPTLYRWWPNKIALLLELYDRHKDRVIAAPDHGDFRADLVDLTRSLWSFWRSSPAGAAFAAIIAEAQSSPETRRSLADHFADDGRNARNVLNLAIERAIDRGQLAPDADVRRVREAIMAVNWFHLLCDRLDDERVVPAVDLLIDGLSARRK